LIAADTSTWVAFLGGDAGDDVQMLDRGLTDRLVVMIPVVLTELLSDPKIFPAAADLLVDVPLAELRPGYWQRAGLLRARVLGPGRRARLGDALIAQCCIDEDIPLVTRDRDFKAFSEAGDLHLSIPF
jgi:predicted nucleic acid-binding protein